MNPYQRMFQHITKMRSQIASMMQVGTVKKVEGDYMQMLMGKGADGKDVMSPMLGAAGSMFGGARERRFFKEGQNVLLFSPSGDPAQGMVLPWQQNKQHGPPDHANKSGQDEETYQQGSLRVRKTGKKYEIWIEQAQNNQQQGQQGGGGGEQMEQEQLKHEPKPSKGGKMKVIIDEDKNTVTGIVGKATYVAHEKGAKIQMEKNFAEVTQKGPFVNKPWQIAKSSQIPDYDK